MPDDFPIGTILPFAGPADRIPSDWKLCDGGKQAMNPPDPDDQLQPVIGTSYGADDDNYYLPDLQGIFLRGVDPIGFRDAESANRSPASSHPTPGNHGANPGSTQGESEGWHQHTMTLPRNDTKVATGGDYGVVVANDVTSQTAVCSGIGIGDETQPLNNAVHFVIKASSAGTPSAGAGLVIYFAGSQLTDPAIAGAWKLCDGTALPKPNTSTDQYYELHEVIHEDHGGTVIKVDGRDVSAFCVPDYSGYFLRGVDNPKNARDKGHAGRGQPRLDLPNAGATGNNPGSIEPSQLRAHQHGFNDSSQYGEIVYDDHERVAVLWDQAGPRTTDAIGGAETRPLNTYVEHLICWSSGAFAKLGIAVGTVIGWAGDLTQVPGDWKMCDGTSLNRAQYAALFAAIGTGYGFQDDTSFNLPDYRGSFLRGVDHGHGKDPEAATRRAPCWNFTAPGGPGNSGDQVGSEQDGAVISHAHAYSTLDGTTRYGAPDDESGSDVLVSPIDPGDTWTQTGPDGETRPINVAVYFLIKVK